MVDDEGGLDELLLRHGLEDLGDELALAPGRLGMAAVFLQNGHQLLAGAVEGHLLAGVLAGQLHHGGAAPVAGQIHRRSLVLDLKGAAGRLGRGLDAALGYARQSGIPYGIGFIKNKYIGRTFISPTQTMRENEVNIKLNPIRSVVEGKRVVLIDDSIVRGTTCRRTIDLLWKAGAKEIHMRVSAPPFVSECYYGTDIDDKNNLIATHHTVDEIAKIIGVNSLGYLSLEDVVKLADNTENGFCTACFGGGYPTSIPKDGGKDRFECKISEGEKKKNA